MKLLALDTSTENCSLALWLDGQVLSRQVLAGQRHSELILPMLDELLADSGVSLSSLDGIAYGEGPGSFTGLRIACGVAQGLALGADLPVAGISTLMALAEASGEERVLACLDARIGEIYIAAYERVLPLSPNSLLEGAPARSVPAGVGGKAAQPGEKRDAGSLREFHLTDWVSRFDPALCLAKDAPELPGEGWVGVGSGFAAYPEALQARYAGQVMRTDGSVYPQASAMAQLAARRFARGLGVDAALAAPVYIRNKVALTTAERL